MSEQHHNPANQDKKPTLIQTISSILAALFGVQSAKNRERDFTKGDAGNYIGVYVVLVLALVIGMVVTGLLDKRDKGRIVFYA